MAELDPKKVAADEEPTEDAEEEYNPYVVVDVAPINIDKVIGRNDIQPIATRRPMVGVSRHDSRFTTIEVIARSDTSEAGIPIDLINSSYSSGMGKGTSNFFIQSFSEADPDSAAVRQTFSSWLVAKVSSQPTVVNVTGVLLDSKNFQWATEWRENFRRYLSAGQCVLRRAMVFMTYKNMIYVGYIINAQIQDTPDLSDSAVQFTFQMVVRRMINLNLTDTETLSDSQLRQAAKNIVDPVVSTYKGTEGYSEEALNSFAWARSLEMVIPEEGWDGIDHYYDEIGISEYDEFEGKALQEELEKYSGRYSTDSLERFLALTPSAGEAGVNTLSGGGTSPGGYTNQDTLQGVVESEDPTWSYV